MLLILSERLVISIRCVFAMTPFGVTGSLKSPNRLYKRMVLYLTVFKHNYGNKHIIQSQNFHDRTTVHQLQSMRWYVFYNSLELSINQYINNKSNAKIIVLHNSDAIAGALYKTCLFYCKQQ